MQVAVVCCRSNESNQPQLELWENVKLGSYSSVKQVAKLSATSQEHKVIPGWCERSGHSHASLKCCYVFLYLNDKTEEFSVKVKRASASVRLQIPPSLTRSLSEAQLVLRALLFLLPSLGRLPLLPPVNGGFVRPEPLHGPVGVAI